MRLSVVVVVVVHVDQCDHSFDQFNFNYSFVLTEECYRKIKEKFQISNFTKKNFKFHGIFGNFKVSKQSAKF